MRYCSRIELYHCLGISISSSIQYEKQTHYVENLCKNVPGIGFSLPDAVNMESFDDGDCVYEMFLACEVGERRGPFRRGRFDEDIVGVDFQKSPGRLDVRLCLREDMSREGKAQC